MVLPPVSYATVRLSRTSGQEKDFTGRGASCEAGGGSCSATSRTVPSWVVHPMPLAGLKSARRFRTPIAPPREFTEEEHINITPLFPEDRCRPRAPRRDADLRPVGEQQHLGTCPLRGQCPSPVARAGYPGTESPRCCGGQGRRLPPDGRSLGVQAPGVWAAQAGSPRGGSPEATDDLKDLLCQRLGHRRHHSGSAGVPGHGTRS